MKGALLVSSWSDEPRLSFSEPLFGRACHTKSHVRFHCKTADITKTITDYPKIGINTKARMQVSQTALEVERNLDLLGVTAIEDKLQVRVP